MSSQKRAVALISGGLDSLLAARLMLEQGIHVEGINFYTGFCVEGHTHAIRKKDRQKPKRNNALWSAEQLGIKLHIVDIIEEYKDVVLNPSHGYGANLNPCLDCKIFMVNKAKQWMEENGFDFIITGEVIGQRPMSQRKDLLPVVMHESGAEDLLVRPLCARNLAPTLPEREGWIDREQLMGLSGRGRKAQIALAEKFGYEDYATPAGGCCFLTDRSYSHKLADLWQARNERDYELDDIMLLKVGRHLRPDPRYKLIIAREDGENRFLQGYKRNYGFIEIKSHNGPLTLVDGKMTDEDYRFAARIAARFSQGREADSVRVKTTTVDGIEHEFDITPLPVDDIQKSWYL